MPPQRIWKLNQGLLTGTAILGLVSIVAGGAGGPVLTGIANFTAGIVANNLGALIDKLRQSRDVLRNQDIAKAAGRAVGLTLEKISSNYPELQQLEALAKKTEDYWVEWTEQAQALNLFESLQEDRLYQVFSNNPEEFLQYEVLPNDEWREVVTWLFEQGCEKQVLCGSIAEYQDVIADLAQELAANFNKNLRQVLKDDAAKGGEAFAGMLLDLHGATLAQIGEIQQSLTKLATREDICRVLQAVEQLRRQGNPTEKPAKLTPSLGAVDTVPKLPPHFLPRPEDIQELKSRLLTPAAQTLVMTGQPRKFGLQGMGGIGKSVLAAALARDVAVRRQFRDGVVWLKVGINPQPIPLYQRLASALGETYAFMKSEAEWDAYLSTLLADKSCLLVLDNVWEQREAERFVEVLGENCRLLLTTRDARLISGLGAQGYQLEMLGDNQALQLLANWAGLHREMLPVEAEKVVKHCGKLPLALALSGAQIQQGTSWADLLTALEEKDLKFLDHPHGSIYKSLEVSITALAKPQQQAYLELGLLAPDVAVSEAALVKLWGRKSEIPEHQLRRWLTEFAQRALVFVVGKSPERWVSLHDVQQKYLQERLADAPSLHREWLQSYGGGQFPWCGAEVTGDLYLYQQAWYHFREAGEEAAFGQLLGDFAWLQQKLAATDIKAVLEDFAQVREKDEFLSRLERTLFRSAHVLNEDKSQLAEQLWGRLLDPEKMQRYGYQYFWQKIPLLGRYLPQYPSTGRVEQLLQQALIRRQKLWFRPLTPCFDSPDGALIRTLTGHRDMVRAVAIAPDGKQAVSASDDNTLKLWDLATGQELHTLKGHRDRVRAVAITPDGKQAVSGSNDNTLKLWDLATGQELRTLRGYSSWVRAVAITPDGKQAISGSLDHTLKLWDLATGREVGTLTGHSDTVTAVAITPDGKQAISGSGDSTLKLWDLAKGHEIRTLKGHSDEVWAVAITPDGKQAISGSLDHTLKLWDLATGQAIRTLTGHSDRVTAVAITLDGKQAISGSWDKTLKLWDLATGR
ncbi:MAG: NB-ARC domain-containing protein, partial [Oscillatoria sp. PMC 1076.18]|nr:NB-ARC domain-containing protein [Oscillatoria sp. PMC 1076.18]